MSDDEVSLAVAEQRSQAARKRLADTLVALQARLNPKALAREAVHELREAGEELAREGVETIKRHPLTLAGVGTALALFVARKPLRALIASEKEETPSPPPRLPSKTRTRGTPT